MKINDSKVICDFCKQHSYLYLSRPSSSASQSRSFLEQITCAYLAQYSLSPESSLSPRDLILNWELLDLSLKQE